MMLENAILVHQSMVTTERMSVVVNSGISREVPPACSRPPPNGTQFFRFHTRFQRKAPTSEVGAPQPSAGKCTVLSVHKGTARTELIKIDVNGEKFTCKATGM